MEIKTMVEVMGRFRQLSPDGTECGCLKAIVLFKPGEQDTHIVHRKPTFVDSRDSAQRV